MKFRVTPRSNAFYDMFAASAANLVVGVKILTELLGSTPPERAAIGERMKVAEHASDEITHAIMNEVNSSFITPFDREDIYRLASSLDDVMDAIEAAVDLVVLYNILELPGRAGRSGRGPAARGRGHGRRDAPAAGHAQPARVLDRDQPAGERRRRRSTAGCWPSSTAVSSTH